VKNNKRDKKHPLAEKVDKAFKGKEKKEPRKKDQSDDKLGFSRGKSKSTPGKKFGSSDNKYTGLGNKHKSTEKTRFGDPKTKSGTGTGTRFAKSSKPTGTTKYSGEADGSGKGADSGFRKSPFKGKPTTSSRKDFDDRKGTDSRKDKPERGDRKTPKKFEKGGYEKNSPRENSEGPKSKSFSKSKTPERYKRRTTANPRVLKNSPTEENPDGTIRLNRYIANSGVCSRRDADELISQGLVEVNGKVMTEMGYKVNPGDVVRYDGGQLKREKMVYLLLNKPKDFITTMDDPQERKTVMQLIAGACKERVYPVGRLDRNTTGLLLLTNDGALTEKLTHPSYKITKVYQVELDRALAKEDFNTIEAGNIVLEDGPVSVTEIAYGEGTKKVIGIQIHEGRNRIVRRIFEHLGYTVERLDRTMYAGLTKRDLPRGNWRMLTEKEIINLKHQR